MSRGEPAPGAAAPPAVLRLAPWSALLAALCVAVLPFGRVVEWVVVLMAVLGLACLVRLGRAALSGPGLPALLIAFGALWLAMVLALPDAADPARSVPATLAYLRYLLAGALVVLTVREARLHDALLASTTWILLVWSADVLVQGAFGRDLLGYAASGTRLNGPFGDGAPKFAIVTSLLLPLAVAHVTRRWSAVAASATLSVIVVAVLAAGTRAAWITLLAAAAVYAALAWRRFGRRALRPALAVLGGVVLVAALGYALSDRLRQRVDTIVALARSSVSDPASSPDSSASRRKSNSITHRLWIWRGAVDMILAHPVNGVGPRGFRTAFPDHARPGDPYLERSPPLIPTHSHHYGLEILAETGALGALGFIAAVVVLVRAYARAPPAARERMSPYGLCLAVGLFPLNTHLAFYASFWSQLMWWLAALYLAASALHPRREGAG